jgi:hypothetical protein
VELSRTERRIQIAAAAIGFGVAIVVSFVVGATSGVATGIATFFLSWTFIALFVLLVRFVSHRLLRDEVVGLPKGRVVTGVVPEEPVSPRRHRKRRRR